MKSKTPCLIMALLFLSTSVAWAEPIAKEIYYTKKHANGTFTFKFSLWDAETDGTEVWSEGKVLKVAGGLIKTYLGDTSPLEEVDFSQQYWVQVERRKVDLTYILVGTRERFSVVPYALWSQTSRETVTPGSHTHPATDITSETLDEGRFSAYSDLSTEGYLDSDADTDLSTRAQADSRYVNENQTSSITSAMIVDGTIAFSDIGQNSCTSGQIIKWNGSTWTCADDSSGSHSHSASDVTSGTLSTDRFSAYSDLSAEGYLDNSADTDLLTRTQSDGRYATLSTTQIIGGAKTFSSQIASSVATGTAPFSISSTTLVSNLNAEMLGGYTATALDVRFGQAAPLQNPRANTITTVDSTGISGWYSSITIGTDGLPVISYYRSSYLGVTKCGNTACSSGNTTTQVDTELSTGEYTSIAIGTDGYPVVSYYNYGDYDLKVVKCGNASCSSGNTITTVDSTGDVGKYSSIAVGTGGFPVVAYYDTTNGDLKVVKCGDTSCSSGNTITTVDSTGTVGKYVSIAIGTDGVPVISYYDETNSALKVAKCGDISCSAGNTLTAIDSAGVTGEDTSITIGADGLPIISYYDWSNHDLKVAKCGDTACSAGNTLTTIDSTEDVGWHTSITIGPDGLPIISYYDYTNQNLKVAKCGDTSCSANNTVTPLDSTGNVGQYTAITLGTDGLPIIAYFDNTNYDLKVIKCANSFCLNYWTRR